MYPENSSGLIIGHYERHARAWDADRRHGSWNDKLWLDRFVALLPKRASVLDLGCGGGSPVALHLVKSGMRITGIDASPSMIALCRERMPDQEWIVADMRSLSLGRQFDAILAWDSFFHLKHDDQGHMFDVFADHSAAGTILMFNAGDAHGEVVGSYRGDPLYHASLDPFEYEVRLQRIGYEIVAHVAGDRDAGDRTAWIARCVRCLTRASSV
jgi:SAM-dependent methyltransferase